MENLVFVPLFAGSPFAHLNVLCFCLSVFCGYWLVQKRQQDALVLSLLIGFVIGFLLVLDDAYSRVGLLDSLYYNPRPLIGLIGGGLGWFLAKSKRSKQNMLEDQECPTSEDEEKES